MRWSTSCTARAGRPSRVASVRQELHSKTNHKDRGKSPHEASQRDTPSQKLSESTIEMAKSNALWNPFWNPINNPINSPIYGPIQAAKIAAETFARNLAYIQNNPNLAQHLLPDAVIDQQVTRLWEVTPMAMCGGLTLQAAFESGDYSIYIGLTKQLLHKEDTRFLK
jgi:hypothetical protein